MYGFAYLFTVLASLYIIYDVEAIRNKHGFSKDDYIVAALILYTDIMYYLYCLLECFGGG